MFVDNEKKINFTMKEYDVLLHALSIVETVLDEPIQNTNSFTLYTDLQSLLAEALNDSILKPTKEEALEFWENEEIEEE